MGNGAWVWHEGISQVKLKLRGYSQPGEPRSHFGKTLVTFGEALRTFADDVDVFIVCFCSEWRNVSLSTSTKRTDGFTVIFSS